MGMVDLPVEHADQEQAQRRRQRDEAELVVTDKAELAATELAATGLGRGQGRVGGDTAESCPGNLNGADAPSGRGQGRVGGDGNTADEDLPDAGSGQGGVGVNAPES
eukprot:2318822-Rhodomonas_salina.1